jgi:glycosyltransferase involved in cell wall biosynthesis
LNLQDVVLFLAEVTSELIPDSVIADFYQLADAVLFPSREEGFGIPLIEAAVSSVPVFCADIPVLHELGGEDVSYFDLCADPNSIAGQITDRMRSEATSRWSRRAKHSYTWDAIYTSWIAPLLQEVHHATHHE